MREVGIDLAGNKPKRLTVEMQLHADWAVTMGCGDVCPYVPTRVDDWDIPDPAGKSLDEVREIRDLIQERVRELVQDQIDEIQSDRDLAPMATGEAAPAADRGVRRHPAARGDPRLRRPNPRRLRRRPDPHPHLHARAQAHPRVPAPRHLRSPRTRERLSLRHPSAARTPDRLERCDAGGGRDRRQRRGHQRRAARARARPDRRGDRRARRRLPELLDLRHPLLRLRRGRRLAQPRAPHHRRPRRRPA